MGRAAKPSKNLDLGEYDKHVQEPLEGAHVHTIDNVQGGLHKREKATTKEVSYPVDSFNTKVTPEAHGKWKALTFTESTTSRRDCTSEKKQ
ncbi:hypothetical protein PoB_007097200 [Plakobranchus ocellatus]|uniref:Uncharacterized protein n=1 Tax=Plakobranchus ocellatus TaxID=259542 RepID=A0AAV4DK95_9GAST|nr:hypothetical protein PoB_007097200 [Plakobranchus ocellatus]